MLTGLCNCIWKRKEWPTVGKKSVYVPIYKKGDQQECGNYRTIALISHASNVLLRIIKRILEVFITPTATNRARRGTRDHTVNLRWMVERARELQAELYTCFIDYKNAFDSVDHDILWVILMDMAVPVHLIVLLRRLYTNQEATVRTERGISIGGMMVTNLIYADDTTLLAGTIEDLIELVGSVRRASEKTGLYLNVGKTKMMTTGYIGAVTVYGKDIEAVTKFVFLGALITEDGLCEKEVRRSIAMGKAAMGGLT